MVTRGQPHCPPVKTTHYILHSFPFFAAVGQMKPLKQVVFWGLPLLTWQAAQLQGTPPRVEIDGQLDISSLIPLSQAHFFSFLADSPIVGS